MRGKGNIWEVLAGLRRITPAYAGKRLSSPLVEHSTKDHPRVCGEKALCCPLVWTIWGSPPRMRGKAGIACTALCAKRDHPRVCGEKPRFCTYLHALKGSPPRMRGKVWRYFYYRGYHRITPAYAGKRRSLTPRLRRSRDHPRVCGEKHICPTCTRDAVGSPPRMRGKAEKTG